MASCVGVLFADGNAADSIITLHNVIRIADLWVQHLEETGPPLSNPLFTLDAFNNFFHLVPDYSNLPTLKGTQDLFDSFRERIIALEAFSKVEMEEDEVAAQALDEAAGTEDHLMQDGEEPRADANDVTFTVDSEGIVTEV